MRGNEKFRDGELPDAMACYSAALELDPDNTLGLCHILHVNRAVVRGKLGATDDAITDCTAALEIDAFYTKARLKRAELYKQKGDMDEAHEDYTAVLEAEPQHKQRPQIQKVRARTRVWHLLKTKAIFLKDGYGTEQRTCVLLRPTSKAG